MKHKRFRRSMSVVLAVTMATSCLATGLTALAADSWPNRENTKERGEAQPHFSGYRMKDVRNWDSETDPFAEMMRAKVPLQDRNEPFKPTQANPEMESDAKIMLMQGDYGNSFVDSMMYNNDFAEHCLNFWQYTDYFCPWHGAATAYTPPALYDPATSDWRNRGFEFGMLNIPNPAYTNAAHKNGVMSIGCLYFDQAFRAGQSINELLEKDEEGNFLLVDKLVAIANYYGFDGYFLNKEDYPNSMEDLHEFMRQMHEKGMYTQYYDVGSSFTSEKGNWIKNGNYNSIFFNYGGWGSAQNAYSWCNENGLNVYDAAFFGVECNQGQFSRNVITAGYMPGTNNLYASVALFTPSDFYQRGVDFGPSNEMPSFQRAEYQWMVTERERMFFSGVTQDPTDSGLHPGFARPDLGISNASGWVGSADFTTERSVVDGSVFYTNFNTGHGMQYFDNGAVSHDDQWANINIQDILPSWQWWVDTEGTELDVDFDYGSKEIRYSKEGTQIEVPYTQIGAYKGGSSLAVYGYLDAENFLRLYKTDLSVNENTKVSITFNKTSADDASKMEVGVIFKNDPNTVVNFNVPQANKQTDGWVTKEISLGDYAGEEIAAIGVNFDNGSSAIVDYQMNIGELKVTDGENHTPDAPAGLKIREAYDSKEMVLTWDLGSYDNIDQYNVYANLSDGRRICMGGIYDNVYYVKNTFGTDIVTMEVTAVGKDGTESAPATIEFAYNENVSNIQVEETLDGNELFTYAETPGYLDVSWENPNVDYASLELELSLVDNTDTTTYTTTVAAGEASTRFYIPRGHGETYDLKISTVYADGSKSEPIAYRGKLHDTWSQPIDRADVKISGKSISFVNPASVDWYKIHGYVNGGEEDVLNYKRGSSSINREKELPGNGGRIDIVLEDYSGNMSEPVSFVYGGDSSASGPISETNVPDAVLRQAILDQVGSTTAAAEEFTGTLDLTGLDIHNLAGLNLVSHAENIILSGTPIESIGGDAFGAYVQKIDLSNCANLKIVDKAAFADSQELREVDITGCSALQVLEIVDSSVEKLAYGDAAAFPDLIRLDLSGSRFDMSENTAEYAFAQQIAAQTGEDKGIETIDPNPTNLALGAEIVEDQTTISIYQAVKLVDGNKDVYISFRTPNTITIDLGAEQTITSWTLVNDMTTYGLADFEIKASNDGQEYTTIVSVEGNSDLIVNGLIANPAPYRYYQLVGTKSFDRGGDIRELELKGHKTITYTSEVIYGNQRPRLLASEINTTVSVDKKNGQVLDLNKILADAIAESNAKSVTVNGNTAGSLGGATWLDPDYTLAPEKAGKTKEIHLIQVTDVDGNTSYADTIDGSVDGSYT
ncbi:MAG: endo-beta-N-acetylglucosaminidase, partial [Clostridium sp.]